MSDPNGPHTVSVSLIIVTWNGLALLQKCLPSVVRSAHISSEIIVVDNASTDGTAAWLAATYPSIRVLGLAQNRGFSYGNNQAIRIARGRYVVLLNNDVEVEQDWLDPIVALMDADDRIGAAQPKLLQFGAPDRFEYAGASGGFLDRLGYPFTRGRVFLTTEEDAGQYDDEAEIFWASGAALVVRKSALDQVGLLDEDFYMHMEEIDLCWRLKRFGYRILAVPGSRVRHVGGASLSHYDPRKTYFNFRNSILTLYKNLPRRRWRSILLQRLLFDAAAAVRFLLTGRPRHTAAVFRAYADGRRMRKLYSNAEEGAVVLPSYRGVVAIDYFLFGRRRFSQLAPSRFDSQHPVGADSGAPALSDKALGKQ